MDFSKVVSAVHKSLEEPVSLGAQNIAGRFELPLPNNESLNNSLDIEADGSDDASGLPSDDFEECWRDMDLAMEIAKENEGQEGITVHIKKQDPCEEDDGEEVVCVHDCKLDVPHGLACQICGLIEKKIDTIIEYQWHKDDLLCGSINRQMWTRPIEPEELKSWSYMMYRLLKAEFYLYYKYMCRDCAK